MKLEDIQPKALIEGIEPGKIVTIRYIEQSSPDVFEVGYKLDDGTLKERQLFRWDEEKLSPATIGRHFTFTADADCFKLVLEAYRISNAHLFDPFMAVHSSNITPLPHQITAVYETMLPKQPLRFVLADDPGAGKTIMAGLLMRELIARSDTERILIVSPGVLVEQWQDELAEKFGLKFTILSNELSNACRGNVFEENNFLIARIDQLKRNEGYLEMLEQVRWDLVIVDEAHKMSASVVGNEVKPTKRFKLGVLLSQHTKHFLLMTATPHNGKEEEFQVFLSLLDRDRFYPRIREKAEPVNVSDIMRRMCKEDLLTFDGTKLFPERFAITARYDLSDLEMELYEEVTQYVREEMNRADRIRDRNKRGNVGFALTSLQRRLASSPWAIFQSLKRRQGRLSEKLVEWEMKEKGQYGYVSEVMGEYAWRPGDSECDDDVDDPYDSLTAEEFEEQEERFSDRVTAAQSIEELRKEIGTLKRLEEKAQKLVDSHSDRKWDELSRLLQTDRMRDEEGMQRKLIIFTEFRDTLTYLVDRVSDLLGSSGEVVAIHGGVDRLKRKSVQTRFRNVPEVRVMIATDAAGEGVNLQNAHLMINYDLPWNPNRIEQRFGRIHRIGQTEVCYLWNLIARETREGEVFALLFEKLEREREALGGKVFDVLGEVFEDRSLADLLMDAVRYGEDPKRREEFARVVEGALDRDHIEQLIRQNALTRDYMDAKQLFAVRDEMERAEARKLQPYFVGSYFVEAFRCVGGSLNVREKGRYQISRVPQVVVAKSKQLVGSDVRNVMPVVEKYERVCFAKEDVKGRVTAELLFPAHSLMRSVTALVQERYGMLLKEGAVLVDPTDESETEFLLFVLDHKVVEGDDARRVVSRRYQFVRVSRDGKVDDAGFAPHLDMRGMNEEEAEMMRVACGDAWWLGCSGGEYDMSWLGERVEERALSYANACLVPDHYREVSRMREAEVDKTRAAVHQRLTQEIDFLTKRRFRFEEDVKRGKGAAVPSLEKVKTEIDRLKVRLRERELELERQRGVVSLSPVVVAACVVIPEGMLRRLTSGGDGVPRFSPDADVRRVIEQKAMEAVMRCEREHGFDVEDVSKLNCGWDVTSRRVNAKGDIEVERHIEVKGKGVESPVVTVSRNEMLSGLNQGEKFVLAVVQVDGDVVSPPRYVHKEFLREPAWGEVSVNYDLDKLLEISEEF
ncbi:MAG TPA: helicase-related protein [Methanocorpusculum sp.]|nr:helicase-related protein [Methanocorpusculum sp.]HJK80762.1 helicase-related protein [Methanocorpusculum sp.]